MSAALGAAMQALADSLLQPLVFLSGVAYLLAASNYQIAGFSVAAHSSWAWAGAIVWLLRLGIRQEYQLVVLGSFVRLLAVAAIGLLGYQWSTSAPDDFVRRLLIAFAVYQIASAIAGRATASILAASRSSSGGGIFRKRAIIGIIAAIAGTTAAWSALRSAGTFDENAGLILMLAAVSTIAATWFLLAVPGSRRIRMSVPERTPTIARMIGAFDSPSFRRYVFFRSLLVSSAAADPFLIVYGLVKLDLAAEDIGLALVAFMAGQLVGVLVWPRWIAARGARGPLQVSALLRLLVLIVTVSLPSIVASQMYSDRFDSPVAGIRCFVALFGVLGLIASANNGANQRYLLDILPGELTRSGIGLTNAILGALAFGPLGAAWLIERYSLESMFYTATGLAFIALLGSGLLTESRVRVRQRFGARRVRRDTTRRMA